MKKSSFKVYGAFLLAALLAPILSFGDDIVRLDPSVAPVFQTVELNLDAQKTAYSGSVQIELTVKTATNTFRFHAEEMTLDRLEIRGKDSAISVKVENGAEGLVTATTEEKLSPGQYTLVIDFHKNYNTQAVGLYRVLQNEVGYLFTQFEAIDARKAFPCWDEPIFKIPFEFTIFIPENQVAVTNTPAASETVAGGVKTYRYQKTKPLPTYLLAIAAGPLESVEISGLSVPGRVYTTTGQRHLTAYAVETTPPILKAIEAYFGSPYPYEKLDLIAIPEYWPGAMENPGAITYKDNLLLMDPQSASVSQKRRLVYVTAHELAHIWFGDLVTMKWWDDLWLNESFADWMAEKISHPLYPQFRIDIDELQDVQRLFTSDARPSTRSIRRPVVKSSDIFEDLGLAYGKGKKILGMVEQWIGEEAFRSGVINYLNAHAWGNAEAADLWGALSKTSGKNVESVLASFLEQPGFPMITVSSEKEGAFTITQKRFLNYGVEAANQNWILPLRLKYFDETTVKFETMLLDEASKTILLGGDVKWIMPDADAYGYYRWNIPREMLLHLAENPQNTLTEREQVAFLGNAASLLDAGIIGGDTYLSILNGFARSPQPEIVSSVAASLRKIREAFIPDDLRDEFAYYIRATFRPALEQIGLEKKPGEAEAVSALRPQLITWLGDEGQDAGVRNFAKTQANAYMANPLSIDPSIAGAVLNVTAIEGDNELFQQYKNNFENTKSPVERDLYLRSLGAFSDAKLQEAAFAYILEGPLRPNELFTIPRAMAETDENRNRYFHWMLKNYEELTSRIPKEFAAYMPLAASGCSEERLKAASEFFSNPEHQVPGTINNLKKVSESVTDCVNLRTRESAAVTAYLAQLVGEYKNKSREGE